MSFEIETDWIRDVSFNLYNAPEPPEDEATLSVVSINVHNTTLTEVMVLDEKCEIRNGPVVSAYRLAEWLAWNWWRLRWEPRGLNCNRKGWNEAHDIAGIGRGWLWPNITVESDGVRVQLAALRVSAGRTERLLYLSGDRTTEISVEDFESGINAFARRVLRRLDDCNVGETDLSVIWRELEAERTDPGLAAYRKFEACLGCDVDEADPLVVKQLLLDSDSLGQEAMAELATDQILNVQELRDVARSEGVQANYDDSIQLRSEDSRTAREFAPAWRVGIDLAHSLRAHLAIYGDTVPSDQLAQLCGVGKRVLFASQRNSKMAFALHEEGNKWRFILRSRVQNGRRFELARLLTERLLSHGKDRLHPATRSYTYRQKVQRAFASEFLCPVDSLRCNLHEISDASIEDMAEYYQVLPCVVRNQVANNHLPI